MSLFGKIFGKKEIELEPCDLSILGTDVHSHLIPAIDDGAQTMEESFEQWLNPPNNKDFQQIEA